VLGFDSAGTLEPHWGFCLYRGLCIDRWFVLFCLVLSCPVLFLVVVDPVRTMVLSRCYGSAFGSVSGLAILHFCVSLVMLISTIF
jgi:hypothetical protein